MEHPGITPSSRIVDVPTINLDFYPTFAELAGYEIPEAHVSDGVSILSLLRGGTDNEDLTRRFFSWHYPLPEPHFLGGRSSGANRKDRYKYIHFFDDGSDELYDLRLDESETTNLAPTHPAKCNEHRVLLRNWIAEVKGTVPAGQAGLDTDSE